MPDRLHARHSRRRIVHSERKARTVIWVVLAAVFVSGGLLAWCLAVVAARADDMTERAWRDRYDP